MPSKPSTEIVPEMLQQDFGDSPEDIEAARTRSDQIDAELSSEGAARARKRREENHVLLLGQSGAGKSTLNKQFQLLCTPESMDQERSAWRGVIFANIVRSIREIFEALGVHDPQSQRGPGSDGGFSDNTGVAAMVPPPVNTNLMNLRHRLGPLLSMENEIAKSLKANYINDYNTGEEHMAVRQGWQDVANESETASGEYQDEDDVLGDVSRILYQFKQDIRSLWALPDTQQLIKKRKFQPSEAAHAFLRDLDRIAEPEWLPSDDDILYARLRTAGMETKLFEIPGTRNNKRKLWRIADVGGSMSQRQAWIPFFEDTDAIIFLAPISSFDQFLQEDPTRNRIEDSLKLFQSIVNQPLLKSAHIILLLNKTDVLKQKLQSGIKVSKYIPTYGDSPNTPEAVTAYFKQAFIGEFELACEKLQQTQRGGSPNRSLTVFTSSVVDTSTTRQLIHNIVKKLNEDMMSRAFVGVSHRA
ncbi:G-alpha-domain-containing protein [Clavulina sp. PMI_390]|nr:G-alpha-domain-containing protein [Clavulina sp. PMI_390]